MKKKSKKSNNVISLADRLERWQKVYDSPCRSFYVTASTNGALRVNFVNSKESVHLDFIESVRFMSEVSKGFEDMMMDTLNAL